VLRNNLINPPDPLFQRGQIMNKVTPFSKGGLGGICLSLFAILAASAHSANFPLQITQPQPNLTTASRYYKAYPGILYKVPVGVFGGAYPFTYSLATAPSGMTINAQTGIVSWPNPTTAGSPHTVSVRVVDTEGTVAARSWMITVTTTGFLFMDAVNGIHAQGFGCTSNCGTGTINNPFRSMIDVYRGTDDPAMRDATYANHFLYWRAGVYGLEGYYNGGPLDWRGGNKPRVWLAYPGESVTIDHDLVVGSNGEYFDADDGNPDDFYIQGIRFQDMRNHAVRIRGDRIVFFENTFQRLGPGADGSNSSFLMFVNSPFHEYALIRDCVFDDLNIGAFIKTYVTQYAVIEGNSFSNGRGSPLEGIALKADDQFAEVRNNTFDGDMGDGAISGNWNRGGNFEIRFNNIKNATVREAITINHDGTTTTPVFIYRNTIEGRVILLRGDPGEGPFHIYNNVIVNADSGTPPGSHIYHSLVDISDPSVVVLRLPPNHNVVGYPADNVIDANGNLTAAYASYVGTHGYQLGSGTPPPPPSGSACDLNADSSTNVTDVQLCANQAIGVSACSTGDVNQDSSCNVVDVQRVVNAALGGACVTQ
jgi:acetyltransferase-like isoleucine patch superfamily enzyme